MAIRVIIVFTCPVCGNTATNIQDKLHINGEVDLMPPADWVEVTVATGRFDEPTRYLLCPECNKKVYG